MTSLRPLSCRAFGVGCLALFGLGVAVRWAVGLGDDGLGGQDPWAYETAARTTAAWLVGHAAAPTGFFWPLGYPVLGALLGLLTGLPEATALRTLSLVLGAATGPLLALAVALAHGPRARRAGLLAGVVVAASAASALAGAEVMADAAMAFWLVAAAAATAPVLRAQGEDGAVSRGRALLLAAGAGAALGLAVVTRQAALVGAPAVGIAWLLAAGRRRVGWDAVVLFGLCAGVPLLAQLAIDPGRPGALEHAWLRNWRPWHAVMRSFDTPDGHADYAFPQGIYALFPVLHPGYLAPPLLLFLLRGVRRGWCGTDGCAVGPFATLFWAQWLGVAALLFAGMPYQNFRFGLCALPAAAALFGLGAVGRGRLAAAALAFGLLWTAAWTPRMAQRHLQSRQERRALVQSVAEAATRVAASAFDPPRPPLLVAFELTLDLRHRQGLDVIELYDLRPGGPEAESRLRELAEAATRRPLVLVVDDTDLGAQWAGTPIAAALARLGAAYDAGPPERVGAYRVARLEPRSRATR
ncbi:MAG: hypothetical protein H6747_01685 [Deltaproteobacteria bacterium]|nr:hypothetical protein [Deltaproteobacteria bacterium]